MAIELDIEVGDIVLTGKFKNKRTKVKEIGTDDLGQPTINGKPILKLRIEKHLPKEKQSKKTRESTMTEFNDERFKQLAGLLSEQIKVRVDDNEGRRPPLKMKLSSKLSEISIAAANAAAQVIETELGDLSEKEYYELKDKITDWLFDTHSM